MAGHIKKDNNCVCFKCKTNPRYGKQTYCYYCFYEKFGPYQKRKNDRNREKKNKEVVSAIDGEKWEKIQSFPNYEISNLGRIKRTCFLDQYGNEHLEETIVGCYMNKKGYLKARLYDGSNRKKDFGVHQLVAICFIENPEGKSDVHHKDSNKINNIHTNLQWLTKREHAYITRIETSFGEGIRGEEHWRTKLNNEDIINIRKMYSSNTYSYSDLGLLYNITPTSICRIVKRKSWAHI